jgi:hypothetical protein
LTTLPSVMSRQGMIRLVNMDAYILQTAGT